MFWSNLLASLIAILSRASSGQFAVAAAWFLILAGVVFGSIASTVLGGAILFFLFTRGDSPNDS